MHTCVQTNLIPRLVSNMRSSTSTGDVHATPRCTWQREVDGERMDDEGGREGGRGAGGKGEEGMRKKGRGRERGAK